MLKEKKMKEFKVTAQVTVDVQMTIRAETEGKARALFNDKLIMTAGLVDVDANKFGVDEDSISEIGDIEVDKID